MPQDKLKSLKSARVSASLNHEQLAKLAGVTVKALLAEEDAVAKGLPGGGCLEPKEHARIASALATTVAALKA